MSNDSGGTLQDVGEFGLIDADHRGDGRAPRACSSGRATTPPSSTAPDGRVAITCDLLVEGRHFRRDWSTPIDIGRRAAAASLADVAAMGGVATSLVVGFGAPGDLPAAWAVSCAAGIREEAALVGAHLVGGDVVESPQVVISVTALGDLQGRAPVLRSGAQPGDVVAIAGRIGWAAAGLALLSRGFRSPKVLVDAHRFPQPPYAAGPLAAASGATSMIDVSDGLVADAAHVAEASGVTIEIDTADWEIPEPMQAAASAYNVDPARVDAHRRRRPRPAGDLPGRGRAAGRASSPIGRVAAGEPGVTVDGTPREATGGHRHFA